MTIITRHGKLVRRFARFGNNPVWSPDGRRIAFVGSDGLTTPVLTIRSKGGAAHRVMSFPTDYVASIAWMPR
jgi:Tol biopolymer transport system component